ncbi:hypothetical protein MMC18_001825 [Xylographa bjoerkii]|nr:hypothetical protein [Xylographa bjoerkii]
MAHPSPALPSPFPTPSSSRRTSTDTLARSPAPSHRRGNRAALRDYYGLKSPTPSGTSATLEPSALGLQHEDADVKESELDGAGFDAEGYVREVLGREGLEGVLKIEGGLVNGKEWGGVQREWDGDSARWRLMAVLSTEIKGLDGERKALVYDNYSKLITATETIRKMRVNMDPLTPTTSTLSPAIAHIANTAASLASALQERVKVPRIVENGGAAEYEEQAEEKRRKRQTVRWVLDAPRRLRECVDRGQPEVAESDWSEVKALLDKWKGVGGAEEVRRECEKVLEGKVSSDEMHG